MATIITFVAAVGVNVYLHNFVETFDYKIRDYMFVVRGEKPHDDNVIIIDIDEKSINELGQWPWSRNKVSKILENLTLSNIGVIGMDIVFAEEDRSSPAKVFKEQNISTVGVPDYDEEFNFMVQNTPTILGYQFELTQKNFLHQDSIDIPAIIIERGKEEGEELLIVAKGNVLNHKKLQDSGYSSGFFNNIPDSSGVIRSVPMVIKYDDQLYPSLALEVIRASMGIDRLYVNYSNLGVENIQLGDFIIPTDRYGRFIVNFRGPSHTFKYYSAIDIYKNNFNPKDFDGKVALIGTTAAGLNDMRAMPFESVYPGVEVHANIIDNLIGQDFLYIPTWVDGINIIILLAIISLTVILIRISKPWMKPFVILIMTIVILYGSYYVLFQHGIILGTFLPLITVASTFLLVIFMEYIFEMKKEQAIRERFSSKVSKEVMEALIDSDSQNFTDTQRIVTVFFSDVRNFTNISEVMPNAHTLIQFLNEYMDPMTEIIIEEKGTVDKFIGDAVMAYWNAPGDVENHADAAVRATMKQLYKVIELNKVLRKDTRFSALIEMCDRDGLEPLDIGIGINTGEAVVGEMGSKRRSDYTIIGDPVNLGARLESLCKFYGSKCNISNFTKWQLQENYIFRFLDVVTVKGQSKPIQIWQVVDFDDEFKEGVSLYNCTRERLDEELFTYHRALDLYQNGDFETALSIFEEVNAWEDKTNDKIYDIYISRCEHHIENPDEEFDGVFRHTTKG
ncbi:MAG: adenylate/guanylate cyclase domain-containing protein [Campylobacterota bacterium]|nr:adenylate/guanylate cyclase domain-containing protein [Campylobacterota bacterium]